MVTSLVRLARIGVGRGLSEARGRAAASSRDGVHPHAGGAIDDLNIAAAYAGSALAGPASATFTGGV